MENVLSTLMDWIDKALRKKPLLKAILLTICFLIGCGLAYVEWMVG